MTEKTYQTSNGTIHYWVNHFEPDRLALVFLPGLTADHRLFDQQIAYFKDQYNILVWDAPGHAASNPFSFDFTLMDKATWLDEILDQEKVTKFVIIGQSMGGYVGQCYAEKYPEKMSGFISIDSAPLQRKYVTGIEIWLLRRMEPIYRHYPWNSLLKAGCNGVSTTAYGRNLMKSMMSVYENDQKRYAKLSGHGYKMLADAMALNLAYQLPSKSLLICGEKDKAGSCLRYNKTWHKETGIRLEWIKDAGHNSNTDAPDKVNHLIEAFVQELS